MNGYEVDAYRVYNDLYSRMDYAMMYSGDLQNVEFIPRTFEMQPDTFDIVTLFFPFVFIKDHLKWGLPDILFKLKDMISDTWDSLKIGGVMVIVNQGEAENRKQRDELDELDIPILSSFKHESTLFSYEIPRYVILVIKNG